uniref:CMP-sialic acid transporter 5 n=1 Tax=Rhizophora mucronata TaxID=61149 RepID=A0A2P2L3M9_RHIMU
MTDLITCTTLKSKRMLGGIDFQTTSQSNQTPSAPTTVRLLLRIKTPHQLHFIRYWVLFCCFFTPDQSTHKSLIYGASMCMALPCH